MNNQENKESQNQLIHQFLQPLDIKIEEQIDDSIFTPPRKEKNESRSSFSSKLSDLSNSEDNPIKRKLERPQELNKIYKQPRYHPYRFKDYRRAVLTKELGFFSGRLLHQNVFESRNQQDQKRKEKLINKIQQLFECQKSIQNHSFNNKICRIENFLDVTLESFKNITAILFKLEKTISLQRKYYQLEDFDIQITSKKNILRHTHLFSKLNDRLGNKTDLVVRAFLENIQTKRLLPLNIKITTDTIEKIKDQPLMPIPQPQEEFWTIKLHNQQGFCFYLINPTKLREASIEISKTQTTLIELVNLHQDDPRRLKSIHNLGPQDIEQTISQMIPTDIGWIFQYEDIKVKQFMELTHHLFIDQERQTIIDYFQTFFYPVIIFSQIPMFKLGNTFTTEGSSIHITMLKQLRETQLETQQDILEFFGECILINAPKQKLEAIINLDQTITMDLLNRKFYIFGNQLPKLINNTIQIKQISIQ